MGMLKRGAVVSPLLWAMALAALLLGVAVSASGTRAHAGELQGLGDSIIFEECMNVTLTVQSSDADYTSVFWRDGAGTLNVTSKQTGQVIPLGDVPAGELILGIYVQETGYTFWTGPGSRNDDDLEHAVCTGGTVEFEDLYNGGDFDYNDAVLTIEAAPCAREVSLTLEIEPSSTGTGGMSGSGSYALNAVANPNAVPSAGSTFGGWSGDCGGFTQSIAAVMDRDKICYALFLAEDVPPTPTPTPTPPPEVEGAEIGINNTLVTNNPAYVGDLVLFRVDVSLVNVPAENTAEVYYSFNADELSFVGAAWGDIALSECSLMGTGAIYCDFGNVAEDFPFMLHFDALMVATNSTTGAMLGADFDGAGPLTSVSAGPANANVDIIDVAGIQLSPLGDGSVAAASGGFSFQLTALLGVIALGAVAGMAVRLRTGSQS